MDKQYKIHCGNQRWWSCSNVTGVDLNRIDVHIYVDQLCRYIYETRLGLANSQSFCIVFSNLLGDIAMICLWNNEEAFVPIHLKIELNDYVQVVYI